MREGICFPGILISDNEMISDEETDGLVDCDGDDDNDNSLPRMLMEARVAFVAALPGPRWSQSVSLAVLM